MTKEGRLQRGKENFERKRFLDNSETLEYISFKEAEKAKAKAKEAKTNAPSTK